MKLRIVLNQECQLNCVYCYKEGIFSKRKKTLNLQDLKVVVRVAREAGFDEIKFTGGEPTLSSYLPELIDYARKLRYKELRLTTNGLVIGRSPHIDLSA